MDIASRADSARLAFSCDNESGRVQPLASNDVLSDGLERRPVLGIDDRALTKPVGNVLLAEHAIAVPIRAHPCPDLLGEQNLVPDNVDGLPERSNVSLLHKRREYTNGFVRVNAPVCVTGNKGACSVRDIRTARARKRMSKPLRKPRKDASWKREAKPGPDGKTLGHRVGEAMAYATGVRGRTYTESDLLTDINKAAGREILSQQSLNAIRQNKVSRSNFTLLIAKACGVKADWLAYGIGNMLD